MGLLLAAIAVGILVTQADKLNSLDSRISEVRNRVEDLGRPLQAAAPLQDPEQSFRAFCARFLTRANEEHGVWPEPRALAHVSDSCELRQSASGVAPWVGTLSVVRAAETDHRWYYGFTFCLLDNPWVLTGAACSSGHMTTAHLDRFRLIAATTLPNP